MSFRGGLWLVAALGLAACSEKAQDNHDLGQRTGGLARFGPGDCICGRLSIIRTTIAITCGIGDDDLRMVFDDLPALHQRYQQVGNLQYYTGERPLYAELERGPLGERPGTPDLAYDYFSLKVHRLFIPGTRICDDGLAGVGNPDDCKDVETSSMRDASFWCYQ